MPLYFAYGSNMDSAQMAERIPGARVRGKAVLHGYGFRCNKIGRDGTAKANVAREADALVWGVVYEITQNDLERLDHFEGGYARREVGVELSDGATATCEVYVSEKISEDLLPSRTYRDRMVRGAHRHALPDEWRRLLEDLRVRP